MGKNIFQKKLIISSIILLLINISLVAKKIDNKEVNKIDSVTVVANESSNYLEPEKVLINRNGVELENLAKSIQVFNEDLIEDYLFQNIEDVIRISSNTIYTGDTEGKTTHISMRGFSSVPILLDGIKLTNTIAHPEIFNFSAVEIQKGPDSLQYGQSSPGGLVNLVRKKPTKENHATLELELSDNPSYSPKIDLGGSLNHSKSLYYRLVSVFDYDEGWTNNNNDTKNIFIAPSISYEINDNNKITFLAEYTSQKGPTNYGSNINSKGELVADIKNVTSHPDEESERKEKLLGFDFDSFIASWRSNLKYRYIRHTRDYGNVYLPLRFNESTNTVTRFPAEQRQEFSEHALQYTLNKKFNLFNFKNNITFGADYNKAYTKTKSRAERTPYNINLSNPVYENQIVKLNENNPILDQSRDKTYVKSWGTFLQNNINLTQDIIFNLGVRYSESKPQNGQKSNALTPSFGLVYKLTPKTSFYTSYSESFSPNSTTDISGNILDPEEGKGYELGIKQKLFDDSFNLTAAVFKINKENISLKDPSDTSGNSYIASGEQESKGFEIDINGKITDNWSIIASYGYTKTKDKDNNNLQLRNIPKHSANIFTTYYLNFLDLPNIYVGGGARFLGSRYSDDANTIKLDSQIIYNAIIGYKKRNWKFSISGQNLTNEKYVDGSASGATTDTRVYVGTPRTIFANLSYSF